MPATCGAPRGPVLVERLSRSARYKTVDLRANVRVSEPRTSIGVLASPARFELTAPGLGILRCWVFLLILARSGQSPAIAIISLFPLLLAMRPRQDASYGVPVCVPLLKPR
jgi:hypothetical protein